LPDFSLTLLRHRLSARTQSRRPSMARRARPEGRLMWLHLGENFDPTGVCIAVERLRERHRDLRVLITGDQADGGLIDAPPSDTVPSVRAFLDHWRPDIALFAGNDVFPMLWSEALARGIPLIAVEVDTTRHAAAMIRQMRGFDAILALEPDLRLDPVIEVTGPLSTTPLLPHADRAEIERMHEAFGNRPVWLALGAMADETEAILQAHALASRMTHRLLLVLDVDDATATSRLRDGGWRWVDRDADGVPIDAQVLLTEFGTEDGLWLRLAPVTFMGGTLSGDGPSLDPLAMASLGTALLAGPQGADVASMSRLTAVGAVRSIQDSATLGTGVESLLNPEEAAAMAHRGWSVTSEGAEATAQLVDLLDDTLAGIPV